MNDRASISSRMSKQFLLLPALLLCLAASAAAIPPQELFCGDGFCSRGESCSICPDDCGICEPCGNGICGLGESCSNCANDCGVCPLTDQPVPEDYDGDGKTDISLKIDDGRWRIDFASNGFGAWDATF